MIEANNEKTFEKINAFLATYLMEWETKDPEHRLGSLPQTCRMVHQMVGWDAFNIWARRIVETGRDPETDDWPLVYVLFEVELPEVFTTPEDIKVTRIEYLQEVYSAKVDS